MEDTWTRHNTVVHCLPEKVLKWDPDDEDNCDTGAASNDEDYRIRLLNQFPLEGRVQLEVACEPYGVHLWYFIGNRWDIGGM